MACTHIEYFPNKNRGKSIIKLLDWLGRAFNPRNRYIEKSEHAP